jgi:hypothetical protein
MFKTPNSAYSVLCISINADALKLNDNGRGFYASYSQYAISKLLSCVISRHSDDEYRPNVTLEICFM